jgi:hypothetical protein
MATWHVWGDYVHTLPERIGGARLREAGGHGAAVKTAQAHGFDLERRLRNGFEPWAAVFESENDDGQEFAFANYPVVRGWQRLT